jgi:hypothetical protein
MFLSRRMIRRNSMEKGSSWHQEKAPTIPFIYQTPQVRDRSQIYIYKYMFLLYRLVSLL